jgi:TRAP-type C4-dicarboxylate transport system substrate-binding protein
MGKRFFFKAVAVAAVSVGSFLSVPASAQTKLLMSVFTPKTQFMFPVFEEWAKEVERVTQGRVKVEFSAGAMAPPPQQVNAIQTGVFDVGYVANPFIAGQSPLVAFSELPWLVNNVEAASVANWRTYQKFLADKDQYKGVHLLSIFNIGSWGFSSTTDSPINSVDTVKQVKLWALPGTPANILKEMGVSPITSPAIQVSESVSRGVVQGIFALPPDVMVDYKAAPYVKAMTRFPTYASTTSFSMVINKAKWDSISRQDRDQIMSVSGEKMAARAGKAADVALEAALTLMRTGGVKVVDGDANFYTALQRAGDAQVKAFEDRATKSGVDGKALMTYFRTEYRTLAK